METVSLAPLRPPSDFLLESARFSAPSVSDLHRWNNRVINNLIYYQSNYFLLILCIALLVGYFAPVEMLIGLFSVCVLFYAYIVGTNSQRQLKVFKRRYPLLSVLIIMAGVYFITSVFSSILVFYCGIALPLVLVFAHASCRMRNVKNKISQFKEFVGLRRTPMGLILEGLGQEQEAGS